MEIRHCRRCRKIYTYGTIEYCSDCLTEFDEIINKIRDYIYDNPNANIYNICEGTGVDERDVLYLIRVGRLVLSEKLKLFKCEKCGVSISSERYCDSCKQEISKTLNSVAESISKSKKETKETKEYGYRSSASRGISMGIVNRHK